MAIIGKVGINRWAKADSAEETRVFGARPKRPTKGPAYTKLSAACKGGRHSACYAKKCECSCGHGIVGGED